MRKRRDHLAGLHGDDGDLLPPPVVHIKERFRGGEEDVPCPCKKHQEKPRVFSDGTAVCLECVDEVYQRLVSQDEFLRLFYHHMCMVTSRTFSEMAEALARDTFDLYFSKNVGTSSKERFLYLAVVFHFRFGTSLEICDKISLFKLISRIRVIEGEEGKEATERFFEVP